MNAIEVTALSDWWVREDPSDELIRDWQGTCSRRHQGEGRSRQKEQCEGSVHVGCIRVRRVTAAERSVWQVPNEIRNGRPRMPRPRPGPRTADGLAILSPKPLRTAFSGKPVFSLPVYKVSILRDPLPAWLSAVQNQAKKINTFFPNL